MQLNLAGTSQSIEVSDDTFNQAYNEALVHQIVTAYLAGARAGTKAQKTRAEVSGGGKKPWKQKGSGRARAGSTRSPLWRTGGVVFAAKPRNFSQKINKKMYRGAIRSILSELVRKEALSVIDDFIVEQPKTKLMLDKLSKLNLQTNLLIVVDEIDFNTYLAARNLPHVRIIDARSLEPVSLINHGHVLMTAKAIRQIEGQLA